MSDDYSDYETGPFCRHWSDPWDCEELCKRCGHRCREHNYGGRYESECNEHGCDCKSWDGESEIDRATSTNEDQPC